MLCHWRWNKFRAVDILHAFHGGIDIVTLFSTFFKKSSSVLVLI